MYWREDFTGNINKPNKMADTLQTAFSSSFPCIKILVFCLKFHWNFFPAVQLTIIQHWFRQCLGTTGAKPLPEPMMAQQIPPQSIVILNVLASVLTQGTSTKWGLKKMAEILQTIFSNALSWKNIYESWPKFYSDVLLWARLPSWALVHFMTTVKPLI